MDFFEKFICFTFVVLIFSNMATAYDCPMSLCGGENPVIKFPFRLDRQPDICGFPGFNFVCNNVAKLVISLPFMGEFYVREINYVKQEIHLYDPDDCLPRRLLDLSFLESRFKSENYQNYTFFNCSAHFKAPKYAEVECLSTKSFKVLAIPYMTPVISTSCKVIKTVMVPVQFSKNDERTNFPNLPHSLVMTWDEPDCRNCEMQGMGCRLISNSSSSTECIDVSFQGLSSTDTSNTKSNPNQLAKSIVILVGVVTLVICLPCILCILVMLIFCCLKAHFSYNFVLRTTDSNVGPSLESTVDTEVPSTNVTGLGLDQVTIDSYPKVIIDETCRLPTPNGNTCAICLVDYQTKEIVRYIPECKHCFHVHCIDQWLLMNATCPLCRGT